MFDLHEMRDSKGRWTVSLDVHHSQVRVGDSIGPNGRRVTEVHHGPSDTVVRTHAGKVDSRSGMMHTLTGKVKVQRLLTEKEANDLHLGETTQESAKRSSRLAKRRLAKALIAGAKKHRDGG